MNNTTAAIGVPYAYVCEECYRSSICPSCGMHLSLTKPTKLKQGGTAAKYATHWEQEHGDEGYPANPITVAPDGCPSR